MKAIKVGEAKQNKNQFLSAHAFCIFCGGGVAATTQEHTPPRALFRDRHWPEGFVFPACITCNGGTTDDDLMVAFLAHLSPHGDPSVLTTAKGLMKGVNRQFPTALREMFNKCVSEARTDARRLGFKPVTGQTYQGLGVANVTESMHLSVATLACKLTKAIYFKHSGNIFPSDGGIFFHWFTNAQRIEHGRIVALDEAKQFKATSSPLKRNGKDLTDQFDYRYSVDAAGTLHLLQVTFGEVFGFVTIFSQAAGRIELMTDRVDNVVGKDNDAFWLINTNRV